MMLHADTFGIIHTPQFNLTIISSRYNQRHLGMEGGPVDAAIVTLEHMLDLSAR